MDTTITVTPRAERYEVLLTGLTGISHHDPAIQDDSNRMMFNRQKQAMPVDTAFSLMPSEAQMAAVAADNIVPGDVADLLKEVTFAEFVGISLVRLFLDIYNSGEGTGLFSGMARYERLETRARQAAISSPTLRAWWDKLCETLQVGIHPGECDRAVFLLLSQPAGFLQRVLRGLTEHYRSIVSVARLWHSTAKTQNAQYALAIGQAQGTPSVVLLSWTPETEGAAEPACVVDVPAVSGNSLRHQVVREPVWLHLCERLGLDATTPGQGPVPAGVEAIFFNGGNIMAGAKQPSNTFALAALARQRYPSLDLVGGVTDSFDLGESRLRVAGWLVCRENREALRGSPAYDLPAATISVFDLLDDVTLTRQAGRLGLGQMIMSFETLCPGVQVLCRLDLAPYTPLLTKGALAAAIKRFSDDGAAIGGQAARGFGWCQTAMLGDMPPGRDEYEQYLTDNREALTEGLRDGTLGTGKRILS